MFYEDDNLTQKIKRLKHLRIRKMREMRNNGLTLQAIGDVFGVTRQYVYQVLRELGGESK